MTKPVISVTPCRAMMDEVVSITVTHMTCSQPITLLVKFTDEKNVTWTSYGHYRADQSGHVHVRTQPSLGGTYRGVEPMGLFWSLKADGDHERLRWKDIDKPLVFDLKVYQGFLQGAPDSDPVAVATIERWYVGPHVSWSSLEAGRLRGKLFVPNGPGPYPAIIDMYGGGGTYDYRAALLASHGYVTLSLLHMIFEDVGFEGAELDYYEEAIDYLASHPKVNAECISMYGISGGALKCLEVASQTTRQIKCIVCINTVCFKYINLLIKSVPVVVEDFDHDRDSAGSLKLAKLYHVSEDDIDEGAVMEVDKIQCHCLIVVGLDDQVYHAHHHAAMIKKLMKEAGKDHLCQVLEYPKAGHLLEPPYTPHHYSSLISVPSHSTSGILENTIYPKMLWGGDAVYHAKAQEAAWKSILRFLGNHLRPPPHLQDASEERTPSAKL